MQYRLTVRTSPPSSSQLTSSTLPYLGKFKGVKALIAISMEMSYQNATPKTESAKKKSVPRVILEINPPFIA